MRTIRVHTCWSVCSRFFKIVKIPPQKKEFCRLVVASEEARALLAAAPFMVALRGALPARRQWQAGRRCTPTVNFGTSFFLNTFYYLIRSHVIHSCFSLGVPLRRLVARCLAQQYDHSNPPPRTSCGSSMQLDSNALCVYKCIFI